MKKSTLRLTLLQTDPLWEDPAGNMEILSELISEHATGSDIILLPEMFLTGFSTRIVKNAFTMESSGIAWLKEQASSTGTAIAGTLTIEENKNYYNRFLFVTPSGDIITYDKRHLFTAGGEQDPFIPGNKRIIFDYLGWKIALFICYDLRFPVWCRTNDEADLMLFSANWPETRQYVWDTLLKARAIENQCYVAGVNRRGVDGEGISYIGGSKIIDPKGREVEYLHDDEIQISAELSQQFITDWRTRFPVAKDADKFMLL